MKVGFSVNQNYDSGGAWDECILLHCDDNTILRFDNIKELQKFGEKILNMIPEIEEVDGK